MSEQPEIIAAADAYRRLLRYARPYLLGFIVAVFGMLLAAATESGFAALMRPMLDGSFVNKDPDIIRWIPFALLGIFLVRGIGSFLSTYCMTWIGRNVIRDLRDEMFDHLLQLPCAFYDNNTKGSLTSRLVYDVEQVATAITTAITIIIRDTFTVIGLLIWMLYISWKLSLFFLIIVPLMALIIVSISSRFRQISRNIQASMGNVTQVTQQAVESNRIVKIYGAEQQEKATFKVANDFNRRQNMRMAATNAVSVPLSQLLGACALSGVMYFATQKTVLESMTVGTFMSFVTASMLLLAPLKRLTGVTQALQRGVAASQSIFQFLDQKKEMDQGSYEKAQINGDIVLRAVSFHYNDDQPNVLSNINLIVKPGQTIAIVGRSGSGKSTFVNLIPRFYDVTSGDILLDGESIKNYKLANLRSQISMVNQEVSLFNDTIGNNIAYGAKGDVDKQRIEDAARTAHAWEFIKDLPSQLETLVGDRGALLSGGQRQRIAIARAILKDAPILILDEATSALDTESERVIQDAMEKLMIGRTTFVIAHRLSTVEKADVILVMDKGEIIESGTHKTLLEKGEHYAALYNMQFRLEPDSQKG